MPYFSQSKKILISLALGALVCLMPVQAMAAHNHGDGHADMAMDHSAHSQHDTKAAQSSEHKGHGKCTHNGICYMNGLCYMGGFCAILMHPCHQPGAGNPGQTCFIANDCGKSSGSQGNSQSVSKEFLPSAMFSQDIFFACYLLRPPKEFNLAGFTGELEDPPRVFPLL
jgi:hypothetical protein